MASDTSTTVVGIDLGTTNSAVGYLTAEGPRLIPNSLGDVLTPSVVGIDVDGKLLVGRAAKELQVLAPERCASVFKRDMGTTQERKVAGKRYSAVELSSLVLKSLLEDVAKYFGRDIREAVITVPAYFNNHQRQATMMAGQMAGWHVRRIINEPTAAALAYGLHETNSRRTVAVFDLGGGTFDISLVDFFEGAIEVKASAGESVLGGEDFTRALARKILAHQNKSFEQYEYKYPQVLARLLQQCEQAKRKLSSELETQIRLPDEQGNVGPDRPSVTITRDMLLDCCQPILAKIVSPVRRALADAKLSTAAIDEVILVGGATRTPAIAELVTQLFDRPPTCRLNPDEVVALGAAVQAALVEDSRHVEDLVVVDVAPFSLGISTSKQFGRDRQTGYFSPIIHRNTIIPTSRVEIFSTTQPWQDEMNIEVYQGESRKVSDNLFIGKLVAKGIPATLHLQEVKIRFTYDCNGVLEVEAEVVATGKKVAAVFANHARQLDDAGIAAAVNRMQSLKFHPRDDIKNIQLMKRAERVFRELPVEIRASLAERIDWFEGALESQEPGRIDDAYQELCRFLDLHDAEGESF